MFFIMCIIMFIGEQLDYVKKWNPGNKIENGTENIIRENIFNSEKCVNSA